ncbi:hypothetical protein SAMN05216388_104422 [Halorientalis persicus]|uniref:Uncharacterized protein n=1 Tax=Halorientalis persicus TaxID=1367881 RepID=A0A1H8VZ38_9EURY|nr:hypothetical protein [Halorientalis persicus]SEP20533.1 hypothetical protein SAMN05216388_104422 [Halorientalis persicus]
MAEYYSLFVPFYTDGLGQTTVAELLRTIRDCGYDLTEYRIGEIGEGDRRSGALAPADAGPLIEDAGVGVVSLSLDGFDLHFGVLSDSGETEPAMWLEGLDPEAFSEDVPLDVARARADTITDTIAELSVRVQPWAVVGTTIMLGDPLHPVPERKPPNTGVDKVAWVTVFGEAWCAELGGHDRLCATPAWEVRDLGDAGVLVRKGDLPPYRSARGQTMDTQVHPTDYVFDE